MLTARMSGSSTLAPSSFSEAQILSAQRINVTSVEVGKCDSAPGTVKDRLLLRDRHWHISLAKVDARIHRAGLK
jgi:hypothetical protein